MRAVKIPKGLALFLILILLLFFTVNYGIRNLIPADGIRELLISEISSQLGGETDIANLEIPYANRVVMKDVTLSLEGGIKASIPEMELGFDLLTFIFNRERPIKALREVILHRPDLEIDVDVSGLSEGSAPEDIESRIESLSMALKDLQAVLRVRDGVLKIAGGEEILNQALNNIDIDIYTAGWPEIIGEISSESEDERVGKVGISGVFDLSQSSIKARISTEGSDIEYLGSLAKRMTGINDIDIRLSGGYADISLDLVGSVTDPASMDYYGKARLTDLSFTYEGRITEGVASPMEVSDTSGRVDFSRKAIDFYDLGTTIEGERVILNGRILLAKDISFDLHVRSGKDIALSTLNRLVSLPDGIEVISGIVGIDLSIKGDLREILPYGSVEFNDVGLKASAMKSEIKGLSGRALFDGKRLRLEDTTALYGDSSLSVEGSIEGYDGGVEHASTSLRLKADSIDIAELIDEKGVQSIISHDILTKYDIKGIAAAEIAVRGAIKNPIIDLSIGMPNGNLNNMGFSDLSLKASYNDYSLKVEEFSLGIFGGMIRGDGYVNKDGEVWMGILNGSFSGIDAESLYGAVAYTFMDVKGVMKGNLRTSFQYDKGLSFSGLGDIDINNVRINEYGCSMAKALMKFDEDGVNIERLEAYLGRSMVVASGKADFSGALELEVLSNDADIEDLLAQVMDIEAKGSGSLKGVVHGTLSNPVFDGDFELDSSSFMGVDLERVKGTVTIDRQKMKIKKSEIIHKRGPYGRGTSKVEGSVSFGESLHMNLHAECINVGSNDVMAVLGMDFPLQGSMNAVIDVSGTVDNPEFHATVDAADFLAYGQVFDEIIGNVRYSDSFVYIDSARVSIGKGYLGTKGTISPKGDLKLDVMGSGIDIKNLAAIPGDLNASSDDMRIKGVILGSMENPTFDGEIHIDGTHLYGEKIGSVKSRLFIKDRRLTISGLNIGMPSGSITAVGGVDLSEPYNLNMTVDIDGGEVDMLARMLHYDFAGSLDGSFSGSLKASGPPLNPMVEVFLESDHLSVAKSEIDSAVVRGSVQSDRICITDLKIEQKSGYLSANGEIDLEGDVRLDISSKGFDIAALSPIFGDGTSIKGRIDMRGSLSGAADDPLFKVKTEISDGGYNEYSFDELKGELVYSKGMFSFNNIGMRQGDYNAYINGIVPIGTEILSGIGLKAEKGQDEKEIDLRIEVPKTNLSLLSLFIPGISDIKGDLGLTLNIGGSLKRILFEGSGFIEKGGFRHEYMGADVRDLTARLIFSKNQMIIEGVTGKIGDGNAGITGRITFEGLSPKKLDLAINGEVIPISHPSISGSVNADLSIKGEITTPMVSGAIALNKAVIPLEFSEGDLPAVGSINPAFDLNISLGNDAKISRREIDLLIRGDIRIGGTLAAPTASGLIEAKRGRFTSLGMNLEITEGSAEFFEHNGIEPLIDVTAETAIDGVEIRIALHGPATNLIVDLTSTPMMSREEILELFPIPGAIDKVLKGDVIDVFRDDFISIFDQELRSYLVSDISRVFRSTFNLDQFNLESDTNKRMILNIGKYVIDDLYLSYSRSFDSDPIELFEIEYRLSPNVTLSGELDDEGNIEIGVNTKIRF